MLKLVLSTLICLITSNCAQPLWFTATAFLCCRLIIIIILMGIRVAEEDGDKGIRTSLPSLNRRNMFLANVTTFFFFWCLNYRGRGGVFLVSIFFLASFYLPGSSVWLGFQSSSDYVLQSLYLMCKGKHHKSQKHSSVFSNGSLNHSEGEKSWHFSLWPGADRELSTVALDSSDFWLIFQASSCAPSLWETEIFNRSHPRYQVCPSSEALCVQYNTLRDKDRHRFPRLVVFLCNAFEIQRLTGI